jgi:hypothetical protein
MFDVVRFKADASISRVSTALKLTPARRVALVFPLGQHAALAEPAALESIAARARGAHKHVTIVGGDAILRARAAAAGLAAATTVEEWRALPHLEGMWAGQGHARDHVPHTAVLALIDPADSFVDFAASDEGSGTWDIEPPEYVMRLSPAEEHVHTPQTSRQRAALPPSDEVAFERVLWASERDEENISDLIRETSDLEPTGTYADEPPPLSYLADDVDFADLSQ